MELAEGRCVRTVITYQIIYFYYHCNRLGFQCQILNVTEMLTKTFLMLRRFSMSSTFDLVDKS